jgi:hypothetical protein
LSSGSTTQALEAFRAPPPPRFLILLIGLVTLTACKYVSPIFTDTAAGPEPAETCQTTETALAAAIVSDTTRSGYACRIDYSFDADCDDKVYGLRIELDGTTAPGSVFIEPPSDCNASGYAATSASGSAGDWEFEAALQSACPDSDEDAGYALTCNAAQHAQSDYWRVYLPSNAGGCAAWGDTAATWLIPSEDDCDPPANTPHDVCMSANNAPAVFIHRNAFDADSDDTIHTHILPIMEGSSHNYSERTWLREITVTDWGDSTKLYVLKSGYGIHYDDDDVIEDSSVVVLTPLANTATFAEGEVFMGTTFATNSFDTTTFELPEVTFDWSCGVPSPAHFVEISGLPQAFAIRLDDLGITGLGLEHRLKMRIFGTGGYVSFELEGRHHDALTFPIASSGSNWTFDVNANEGSTGIDAAGTISVSGSNRVVTFSRLIVRGEDLGTPTWTLTPFSE